MKNQPAVFLKLLVLLVPREMEMTHRGGVKALSDEQLEAGIEMIQSMLAARDAGASAKVIEGIADSSGETSTPPTPRKNPQEAVRCFPPASRRGAKHR